MELTLLIFYFLIVIGIGIFSYNKASTNQSFFLANRDTGVFQLTGSLLATILGSSAILGTVTFAYSNGWSGVWFMLCAALGLTLLYPLIKYFENFRGYNLPELLGSFYGKEVKNLSSIIIPIAWIGIVAAQIIGAAQIITVLTDINYINAVVLSGVVFIIYTILGGQLSIIKTDLLQLIVLLISILLVYASTLSGPKNYEALGMISEKFTSFDLIIMILTYSSTYLVGPDIYSRIFCAKNRSVAKKSIILSVVILIPLAFILGSLGVYAANLYPNLDVAKVSPLLYMAKSSLPKSVSLILYFGLLSAVISSADTNLMTASSIFTQIFTKNLNHKSAIRITRIFILIFGIFSMIVAIKLKYILTSLLLALSVFSGAFIIPTLAGILGYRGKKIYTLSAIILGGGISFIGKVYGGEYSNIILVISFVINGLVLSLPYFRKKL